MKLLTALRPPPDGHYPQVPINTTRVVIKPSRKSPKEGKACLRLFTQLYTKRQQAAVSFVRYTYQQLDSLRLKTTGA